MSRQRNLVVTTLMAAVMLVTLLVISRSNAEQRQKEKPVIQEAVLQALFAAYGKSVPHEVYFIDLAGHDPAPAFLQRFKYNAPPVLAGSRAGKTSPDMKGIRDKVTGKQGAFFSVGKITWLSPARVNVDWRWYYWMRAGMGATYKVEKINGRWNVKDFVPNSIWKN